MPTDTITIPTDELIRMKSFHLNEVQRIDKMLNKQKKKDTAKVSTSASLKGLSASATVTGNMIKQIVRKQQQKRA